MDIAAECGRLDIVTFLHETRTEGCTHTAMDAAAGSGHLEVIQFLHTNRTEGCSRRAMDYAVRRGYLDVVQFLYANRAERSTTDAIDEAAQRGHTELATFLRANSPISCHQRTPKDSSMITVAVEGDLSVLQAEPNRHCVVSLAPALLCTAVTCGHAHIAAFLLAIQLVVCDRPIVERALACENAAVRSVVFQFGKLLLEPSDMGQLLVIGSFDVWLNQRLLPGFQDDDGAAFAMRQAGLTLHLETILFLVETMGRHDLAPLALEGALSVATLTKPFDEDKEICFRTKSIGNRSTRWIAAIHDLSRKCCRFSLVQKAIVQSEGSSAMWQVRYLVSICCDGGTRDDAIRFAEEAGKTTLAEHLRGDAVAQTNDLSLPDWLIIQELIDDIWGRNAEWTVLYSAISTGLVHTVQVVFRAVEASPVFAKNPSFTLQNAQQLAVQFGRVEILQWVVAQTSATSVDPTLLNQAICCDRLGAAQWLLENCLDGCTVFSMDEGERETYSKPWSICQGRNKTLAFVASHEAAQRLVDFGALTSYAARHGDLRRLKMLFTTHKALCMARQDIMDQGAASGSVRILKFLQAVGYDHCSTDAMDNAPFATLQYLQRHRTECCSSTRSALVNAAIRPELDLQALAFHLKHAQEEDVDVAIEKTSPSLGDAPSVAYRVLKMFKVRPEIVARYL